MKSIPLITLAAVLLLSVTTCMTGQETDAPAPDFKVTGLDGKAISLADYKGKVLFLNFWATWCPPCREEIPDFIEAYSELNDKGLEILGVSVDRMNPQQLKAWVADVGINYPVALANKDIVVDYEPGEYIPASIVVDTKGRIRYRHVGLMDKETLARLFSEYSK